MNTNAHTPSTTSTETNVAAQFKLQELEPRHETAAAYSGGHDSTDLEQWGPTGC
jgi:hypothetical protein